MIGLDNGIAQLARLCQLFHVYALQTVRILGNQMDAGGNHVHIVLQPRLFPFLHCAHRFDGLVTGMDFLKGLIVPLNRHLFRLGFVGFFHDHLHKFRLIQIGINQHFLTLLHMDAAADNQACVFS